jgi:hypothetical protein
MSNIMTLQKTSGMRSIHSAAKQNCCQMNGFMLASLLLKSNAVVSPLQSGEEKHGDHVKIDLIKTYQTLIFI